MKGQIWETKPLGFWAKAKELRAKWENSMEDQDTVLGQGHTGGAADWGRAFRALTIVEDNPAGSTVAAKDRPFARKCLLASESRGWGREICGYHGVLWGQQFLGYQANGHPFPLRKLVVPIPCVCDQHTKRGAQCRDFSPVPQWQNDFTMYLGDWDPEREVEMQNHKTFNTLRMINDIERIFGQKFDEDKLIRMIDATSVVAEYRKEIFASLSNIPAPLCAKDLYSFYVLGGRLQIDPDDLVSFWKEVRDEVRWRVENKIAAVGTERFRFMEAHPPAYYFLKYYRYLEKYGAVCIGSQYTNFTAAQLERKPDGSIGAREYPQFPEEHELKTREDIFRNSQGYDARLPHHFKQDEYTRPYALNEFADIYNVDGALFGIWRSGIGCTLTRKEQAMRLRKAGYSVMCYEGSQPGDPTDLDEKRFLEQLDCWMETNGLRRLDD